MRARTLGIAFFALVVAQPGLAGNEHEGHVHPPPEPLDEEEGADTGDHVHRPPATVEEPRIAIHVTPVDQRRIGLRVGRIERKPLERVVRTFGVVTTDERREAHVHTRFRGWIEDIRVDYVGRRVRKGEVLALFYSPELVAIQEEYLAARDRGRLGGEIARGALDRLRLLDVPESVISQLERGETGRLLVPLESPIDGYVVARSAIQGMYVTPDLQLYHIADLARVWILATLYEYDLPIVGEGDEAEVTLTYEPEHRFRGRIEYVYPDVAPETRTARARIEVANEDLRLKPGMYVNVEIRKDLGERLVVPDRAVIDTGIRKIVFVRQDDGHFEPREVELGVKSEDLYVVASGLREGEEVVTSANFLIDAESRLRAALERGLAAPDPHAGH